VKWPFEKRPGLKIQVCLSVLSYVPCLYTDTHMDTCRHTYIQTYIHTHMHAHTHTHYTFYGSKTDIRMWSKFKYWHVCTCTLIWKIQEESPHPHLDIFKLSCVTITYLRPLCWFILALGATPSTAIKNSFWGWIMRNKTCRKRSVNIHIIWI
jgi:hypothetical protein